MPAHLTPSRHTLVHNAVQTRKMMSVKKTWQHVKTLKWFKWTECPYFFIFKQPWLFSKKEGIIHHWKAQGLFTLLSAITIWNSLWLSCSKNGWHVKDGDHIFLFCSVSWGSDRDVLTVRDSQGGPANSVLFVALFTLKQHFCIHGAIIIPPQLIGEWK